MELIGYARVSTPDQSLDPQLDKLHAAGCDRIFSEKASGKNGDRDQLTALLDYIRDGDVLVVAKLDRLGRSLPHLIETLGMLEAKGIGFRSLSEGIDTTTPAGRLLMHILGAIAQFERDLIIERTHAGLAAARSRGRLGGRPTVMTVDKVRAAQTLLDGGLTMDAAARAVGVSRASLYRAVRPKAS